MQPVVVPPIAAVASEPEPKVSKLSSGDLAIKNLTKMFYRDDNKIRENNNKVKIL